MLSLSTPVFDIDGARNFKGSIEAAPLSRRASRIATLDGGAVISDLGFAVADTDYRIGIDNASRAQHDWLVAKLALYPSMILGCADGCFLVLLSALQHRNGKTTLTAKVLEKLSE